MIRKRSKNRTIWKATFRAAERALIAAVNRRDKVCQLCGSTEVLQMDHGLISRKHLSTFFEIRQMILLCSRCHLSKTFKNYGLEIKAVQRIRDREGAFYIDWIVTESRKIKKWTIEELELMTEKFKGLYRAEAEDFKVSHP